MIVMRCRFEYQQLNDSVAHAYYSSTGPLVRRILSSPHYSWASMPPCPNVWHPHMHVWPFFYYSSLGRLSHHKHSAFIFLGFHRFPSLLTVMIVLFSITVFCVVWAAISSVLMGYFCLPLLPQPTTKAITVLRIYFIILY